MRSQDNQISLHKRQLAEMWQQKMCDQAKIAGLETHAARQVVEMQQQKTSDQAKVARLKIHSAQLLSNSSLAQNEATKKRVLLERRVEELKTQNRKLEACLN